MNVKLSPVLERLVLERGPKPAHFCPVCGVETDGPDDAADHCLWHDLDHATRHELARRVRLLGERWTDVLGVDMSKRVIRGPLA